MVVFPRRGAPETWYPAGVAGVAQRMLTLAGDERVRVVEAEQGDSPDAIAHALLLHGWGCNAFHFRRLLPALARRGIRAYALDLPGHGLSHKPTDFSAYTAAHLADFVLRAMDALDIARGGIVGHSLGAAIALDVAALAPSRVRWLTLLNPVGVAPLHAAWLLKRLPVQLAERVPQLASRIVGWTALHLAYGRLGRPDRGDLEQYLFPTLVPGGRFGMLAYARAFSWDPRARAALARIACHTHVMFGERDRVVRPADATDRLQAIAHCQVDVIAEAGHVLAEEAPDLVADAVARSARSTDTVSAGLTTRHAT